MQFQNSNPEHISTILDRVVLRQCPRSPGLFHGKITGAVKPIPCDSMYCDVCRPRLVWKWVRRASQHHYNWMLTLTPGWDCDPNNEEVARTNCQRQSRAYRRLCELMRKEIEGVGPLDARSYGNERGPRFQHKLHRHSWFESPLDFISYKKMVELARRAGFRCELPFAKCRHGRPGRCRPGQRPTCNNRPIRMEPSDTSNVGYGAKVSYGAKTQEDLWFPRYQRRIFTTAPKLPGRGIWRCPDEVCGYSSLQWPRWPNGKAVKRGDIPWLQGFPCPKCGKRALHWKPYGSFEPGEFVAIDRVAQELFEERVDEETGECTREYTGPNYVPDPSIKEGHSTLPFLAASGRVRWSNATTLVIEDAGLPCAARDSGNTGARCGSCSLSSSTSDIPPNVTLDRVVTGQEGVK